MRPAKNQNADSVPADKKLSLLKIDWQDVFDNMQDLVYILDTDYRFLKVNKAVCDLVKVKPENLIGKKCHEVLHKSNEPWSTCPLFKTLEDKKSHTTEVYDHPNFGKPLLVTTSPILNEKGEVIAVVHIAKDISDRKRVEEKLKQSEHKIRAVLDQTFQFIGLLTVDGILIESNKTALNFAGIEESSVLNKPFWETPWWTHSPELQEKLRDAIKKAAKGEFVRFEATHTSKDGILHYIDFSLKPVKDETGNVIFLIPEGRDITDLKNSQKILARLLKDQQTMLDASPTMIFYKDKENRFIRVNKALAEANNLSKEQIEGKTMWDIYPKEIADHYWQDDKEVMASGKPKLGIVETMPTKDGIVWVRTDKIPYRDEQGNITGIFGFSLDITELKKAKEELEKKLWALETFNKSAVDRELKMVELKKKIEILEAKLKEK